MGSQDVSRIADTVFNLSTVAGFDSGLMSGSAK
jgi:hypothetical protein